MMIAIAWRLRLANRWLSDTLQCTVGHYIGRQLRDAMPCMVLVGLVQPTCVRYSSTARRGID